MKRKIQALVKKFNGELISEDLCTIYEFKTNYGDLKVTFYKNDLTFIPMMFGENFNLAEFLKDSHDNTINKLSYKWNLHSSDKEFNFSRLEQRLVFLTK